MKDPEKSAADSTTRSRENYMKDTEKSAADSMAQSKTNYDKDIKLIKDKGMQCYT